MPLPLEGVRVVDLAQVWAMPGAAMYLGDQGAEVIKVEPLWGDDARRMSTTPFLRENTPSFLVVNRNKRGIAVDIASEPGREIVHRLARWADVLMISFRPGVAERLGYGYEALRELNPRLIYVHATPFGETGEWAHRRGYDLLFQALSGQLARGNLPDGTPTLGGRWTVDTAGSMALAYGAALALYRREKTGVGQRVDAAMVGVSLALQSVSLVKAFDDPGGGQAAPAMTSTMHRCGDGGWIMAIMLRDEDWIGVCRALDLHHLATPEAAQRRRRDAAFQQDVTRVFEAVFASRPREEWVRALLAADMAVAPILTPEEALEHPHLLENGLYAEVEHPVAGRLRMFAPPVRLAEGAPSVRLPAPLLGQHTDQVLRQLGYTPEDVARLRARQVVR